MRAVYIFLFPGNVSFLTCVRIGSALKLPNIPALRTPYRTLILRAARTVKAVLEIAWRQYPEVEAACPAVQKLPLLWGTAVERPSCHFGGRLPLRKKHMFARKDERNAEPNEH